MVSAPAWRNRAAAVRRCGLSEDPAAKSRERQSLLDLVRPQCGVDAMKDDFPGSTPIASVVDVNARPDGI